MHANGASMNSSASDAGPIVNSPAPIVAEPSTESGQQHSADCGGGEAVEGPNSRNVLPAEQINSVQHFQTVSRLHFIGQWRTKADDLLKAWFQQHPEWNHGVLDQQQWFAHIDMDAFFCNVALAKPENAALRDKPVGIAAGRFNSDISSCNYVARKFGIRAGMYVAEARKLCPDLHILGYDLQRCEEVDKVLYETIFTQVPSGVSISMEVYSIDEVMVAFSTNDHTVVESFCERVRQEVANATACTASCGIGPNITVARVATAMAKPNGQRIVKTADVPALMDSLPVKELHGVGRNTLAKLAALLDEAGVTWRQPRASDSEKMDEPHRLHHHSRPLRIPPGAITLARPAQHGANPDSSNNNTNPEDENGKTSGDDHPSAEEQSGEEEANSDEEQDDMIMCRHVQLLKKETLQKALGKKAGETLFGLCRGRDYRVVRRTGDDLNQRELGKTVPNQVGCTMNYAVRPTCEQDVFDVLGELLHNSALKLVRSDLSCSSIRVTLLERHPLHPKQTQKFMGRGFCLEFHVSIPLPSPANGTEEELMMGAIRRGIGPYLVEARQESDTDRAHRFGLYELESVIWTVPVSELDNVVINDLRGYTVQLTGIRANNSLIVQNVAGGGNATTAKKRRREHLIGQISLAAAFINASNKRKTEDADDHQVFVLSSNTTKSITKAENGGGEGAHSAVVVGTQDDRDLQCETTPLPFFAAKPDSQDKENEGRASDANRTNETCSASDALHAANSTWLIMDIHFGDDRFPTAGDRWRAAIAQCIRRRDYVTAKSLMRSAAIHCAEDLEPFAARDAMRALEAHLHNCIATVEDPTEESEENLWKLEYYL